MCRAEAPALLTVELPSPVSVRQAIVQHHRIRYFRGGNSKSAAFPNHGHAMTNFPFVQINPADYLNFLVVDVDHADAEIRLMHPAVPEPHWIITNPETGHAQAGWMIEPVRRTPDARQAPLRYAEAVQSALDSLSDGDPAFTRFLVRNPTADIPAGTVWYGRQLAPYSLGTLMAHMQTYRDPMNPDFRAWNPQPPPAQITPAAVRPVETAQGGRNNDLFRATRWHLWDRLIQDRITPGHEEAHSFAVARNAQLAAPLPEREVRELAASAVRQVIAGKGRRDYTRHDTATTADPYLAQLGRIGGRRTTTTKSTAAAHNAATARTARRADTDQRLDHAQRLRREGHTYQAIAAAVGRSLDTVKRWFRTLRKQTRNQGCILQATGSGALPHLLPQTLLLPQLADRVPRYTREMTVEQLTETIRRKHSDQLRKLRHKLFSEQGELTAEKLANPQDNPAPGISAVPSLTDRFVRITVVADIMTTAGFTEDPSAEGSCITVSVAGHHKVMGSRISVPQQECDAWLQAVVGDDWSRYGYRAGHLSGHGGSSSPRLTTAYYRLFLGPEHRPVTKPHTFPGPDLVPLTHSGSEEERPENPR